MPSDAPDPRNARLGRFQKVSGLASPHSVFSDEGGVWLYQSLENNTFLARESPGREGWLSREQILSGRFANAQIYRSRDGSDDNSYWQTIGEFRKIAVDPIAHSIAQPPRRQSDFDKMSDAEKGVRTTMGVMHTIGGAIASAFGGGKLAEQVGEWEGKGLDKMFGK